MKCLQGSRAPTMIPLHRERPDPKVRCELGMCNAELIWAAESVGASRFLREWLESMQVTSLGFIIGIQGSGYDHSLHPCPCITLDLIQPQNFVFCCAACLTAACSAPQSIVMGKHSSPCFQDFSLISAGLTNQSCPLQDVCGGPIFR